MQSRKLPLSSIFLTNLVIKQKLSLVKFQFLLYFFKSHFLSYFAQNAKLVSGAHWWRSHVCTGDFAQYNWASVASHCLTHLHYSNVVWYKGKLQPIIQHLREYNILIGSLARHRSSILLCSLTCTNRTAQVFVLCMAVHRRSILDLHKLVCAGIFTVSGLGFMGFVQTEHICTKFDSVQKSGRHATKTVKPNS